MTLPEAFVIAIFGQLIGFSIHHYWDRRQLRLLDKIEENTRKEPLG